MSESQAKSLACTITLSPLKRWNIRGALDWNPQLPQCNVCGTGPLNLDAKGLRQYNRVWDILNLDEFEGLNQADLKLDLPAITVEIPNAIVRFLLDNLAARARFVNTQGAFPYLSTVAHFLAYAKAENMKLDGLEPDKAEGGCTLALDASEMPVMYQLLTTPKHCTHIFQTITGGTVPCPFNGDGPRTLLELADWVELVHQLGLASSAEDVPLTFTARSVELTARMKALLKALCLGRGMNISRGPRRLGKIVAQLEVAVED